MNPMKYTTVNSGINSSFNVMGVPGVGDVYAGYTYSPFWVKLSVSASCNVFTVSGFWDSEVR